MRHLQRSTFLLATLAALAGCDAGPGAAPVAPPSGGDPGAAKAAATADVSTAPRAATPVFAEPPPGIALGAAPGMRLERNFTRSYLALDGWKLFAEPDSTGTALAALVLEGSNEVTAAELRLGRSDDATEIARCLVPPAESTGAVGSVDIDGIAFTHFSAGDAAMSHYVSSESYRTVQQGRCYAIDLVVAGTRPEVYDPPRTPPFSNDEAKQKLAAALTAVRWVE